MGLQVKDGGESEGRPVVGRIGVEPGECAVRAVFLSRSLVTRKFGEPFSRGKANDGSSVLAGAPSSATKVHIVAPSVYREVTAGDNVCCSASYRGAFEWLERSDTKVSRAVRGGRGGGNAALLPNPLCRKQKLLSFKEGV
jgi:hypothetical protein